LIDGKITFKLSTSGVLRSKVQQPLLRPTIGQLYISQLEEIALQLIENKVIPLRNSNNELPADFMQELYKWSLEGMMLLALNIRMGCLELSLPQGSEAEQMIESVGLIFRLNQKLDLGMQLWRYTPMQGPDMRRFERTCEVFYSICEKHIRDSMEKIKNKETNKQKTTLLEYLYDKGCDEAASTAILLDILFAGVDTTSHTMAFAIYLLAKHIEVQEKLYQEVVEKVGINGRLQKNSLNSMSYLKAVVKETIRMFAPASANIREVPLFTNTFAILYYTENWSLIS